MTNVPRGPRRSVGLVATCLAALFFAACANSEGGPDGTGGSSASGGSTGSGGVTSSGGVTGSGGSSSGGVTGEGGTSSGGNTGSGGVTGSGGTTGTGGAKGGATGTGGTSTGGATGTGGAKGGATGTGGTSTGGATGTGGAKGGTTGTGGAAGAPGSGGSGGAVTCGGTVPTSGGTVHNGDSQGTAAGLSWSLWSNQNSGSITTFSIPAFSATWSNSGDFLARTGMSWGSGKAVSSLGTVTAQFDETKTGSGGGYSYVGIYGWTVNPCVEWYIVDDSYGSLPFNPGGSMVGTVSLDGGTYNIIARSTTGTGGNRCGQNVTSWNQVYSMRTSKRTCGTISISDHWAAWTGTGKQTLGSMLEASVLIEAGGGAGSINFATANVTAQ